MFSYVYTCPPLVEFLVLVIWNSSRFIGTRFIVISLFSYNLNLVVIIQKYRHQCDRVNVLDQNGRMVHSIESCTQRFSNLSGYLRSFRTDKTSSKKFVENSGTSFHFFNSIFLLNLRNLQLVMKSRCVSFKII